jgi:hypothetical protein
MLDFADMPTRDPMAAAQSSGPSLFQLIREDVACVRLRDPAARSELETLLTYPGVHAAAGDFRRACCPGSAACFPMSTSIRERKSGIASSSIMVPESSSARRPRSAMT